jgi:acetyl esterase/lipase
VKPHPQVLALLESAARSALPALDQVSAFVARRLYAERLARAGVEVAYRDYPDMIHGFILMGGVLGTAGAAVAECCAQLGRAFEKVAA